MIILKIAVLELRVALDKDDRDVFIALLTQLADGKDFRKENLDFYVAELKQRPVRISLYLA